jgi:hypothetical protein
MAAREAAALSAAKFIPTAERADLAASFAARLLPAGTSRSWLPYHCHSLKPLFLI